MITSASLWIKRDVSSHDHNRYYTGDQNNCWDYCFGKEEELATSLVAIINSQKFDGIDIDYEYCYDIAGTQAGRCSQRSAEYTDVKAQTFLDSLTSKLRSKLDALQLTNGYNRGRYEVTHAPMDSDLTPSTSKYFQILKARRADLDFLLPQFYNGVTRPVTDGVGGAGAGAMSAGALFSSLANNLFDQQPNKVSSTLKRDLHETIKLTENSFSIHIRLFLASASLTAVARVQTQMLPKQSKSCPTSRLTITASSRAMEAPSSG